MIAARGGGSRGGFRRAGRSACGAPAGVSGGVPGGVRARHYSRRMAKKWEYATVPLLVHATKQILDTWGEDGWELIQVVPGPNNPEQLVAYFKREKAA